jgi:hypothetical protein
LHKNVEILELKPLQFQQMYQTKLLASMIHKIELPLKQCREMVETAVKLYGGIDLMVSNYSSYDSHSIGVKCRCWMSDEVG